MTTRVAAYCRVSTDNDDQKNSLESQKAYFKEYIEKNLSWQLVDVYADEGITGTSTAKRVQFNKMIANALAGGIDLIVTKEAYVKQKLKNRENIFFGLNTEPHLRKQVRFLCFYG